jgi:cell division protein FtsB
MKILYIGPSVRTKDGILVHDNILKSGGANRSNFFDSSCFGYDVILVNTISLSVLFNRSDVIGDVGYAQVIRFRSKILQWRKELGDWISRGGKLYVIMQPLKQAWGQSVNDSYAVVGNYDFLPVELHSNIKESSGETYLGEIIPNSGQIKQFLQNEQFFVQAYLEKELKPPAGIYSQLTENRITSFMTPFGEGEITFIPEPSYVMTTLEFIKQTYESGLVWKIEEQRQLEINISTIESDIRKLEDQKNELEREVGKLSSKIQNLVESDGFLSKASKTYQKITTAKNPDPREIYDVLETIENAFPSQQDMRTLLKMTRTECTDLKRRCNEFRHDQNGFEPKPLIQKELDGFMKILYKAIGNYLQYLFEKSTKNPQKKN